MEGLKDAFSESGPCVMVDVADWHELPEGMRDRIEQRHELIRGNMSSAGEG